MDCFFWFCCPSILAQNTNSLTQIINNLTDKYHIVFSYKTSDVKPFDAIILPNETSLNAILFAIQKQTKLSFEKLDANNYVITKSTSNNTVISCGIVKDIWGNPIAEVLVSSNNKNTLTDSTGAFHLALNDIASTVINFSYSGYQSVKLPLDYFEKNCQSVTLNKKVTALKEIVITDYITKGMTKKENGSIQIDLTTTGLLPGVIEPDVVQSLQFVPGVLSPDETVAGLHIRGSTPDQNLVLFDGVKVYQDAHFFGLISAFNPHVINDIKLFRSATKAKYGGHAGGVLSIGVDTKIPQKASGSVGATFTHTDAFVKVPLVAKKLAMFASARRSITDISNNITFKNFSEVAFQNTDILGGLNNESSRISAAKNTFLYQDYFSKLIYTPTDKLTVNLSFISNKNELFFRGIDNFITSDFEDNITVKSHTLSNSVQFNDSKFGNHNLQLSSTSFDKQYNGLNQFDSTSQTPTLLEITFDKENFVDETSINYTGSKQLFKNGTLEVGFQRSRSKIGYVVENYGVDFTAFKESLIGTETSQSFFADFEFKSKKTQINLGGRRQFFNRLNRTFWEPRIFLNYKILNRLWLKGTFEKKHQSISQVTDIRNDGLGNLFDKLWVVSTPNDVPILENTQGSIGLDFQKKGWTLDIEAYQKEINGIGILLTNDITNPQNVTGNNTIKGIDVLLKKQWPHYQTWVSYSFSESEYQFSAINDNTPFDGSFDTPHNLVWTHSFNYKNFELSLGYRYHSGIPYTNKRLDTDASLSNFIRFDAFNAERLPDYQRLDLSGSYQFYLDKPKTIHAKLGFTLQNLTNERNLLSRDFRVVEGTDTTTSQNTRSILLQRVDRKSLGFTPNFVFRLRI
ncbi:TonB-dependent receptor plug domain-containing protein [Aquimarina agarivorans]|uniref:TonB-dependent receptor plug domain-containing protein n=1 Tax=Aquimarina agarivorans TaxID=980584 RepID=UPI000248FD8B|nr:TonB-dependent receptor [Aquimarina agarivorans]